MTVTDPLAPARVLRTVAPPDAPYPGRLVADDNDHVRVWVDVRELDGVPAWAADTDGHILAPLDYARTRTGIAAVLPQCASTVASLLARRDSVSAGEAVTLAVGLLRGAVEAHALDAAHGTWWLTTDGRPVLAFVGDTPWDAATATLLTELAARCPAPVAALIARAADAVVPGPHLARDAVQAETALFAACAGAPIVWQTAPPTTPITAAVTQRPADGPGRTLVRDALARHIDVALADRVGELLRTARSAMTNRRTARTKVPRERPPRAPRATRGERTPREPADTGRRSRAPLLVGFVVAAAILVAGVTWPADEPSAARPPAQASVLTDTAGGGDAAGAPAETDSGGHPEEDATPAPPLSEAAATPDAADPVAAAAALLTAVAACDPGDAGCLDGLVEDASRPLAAGVATTRDASREVTLLDELGGVAVLRADSATGDAVGQIVVIVSDGRKWLVREIYDLADQP